LFPEGGSHDRTELLPLKAGFAIMALGTVAAHPGAPLFIVPTGLYYFRAHAFRSTRAESERERERESVCVCVCVCMCVSEDNRLRACGAPLCLRVCTGAEGAVCGVCMLVRGFQVWPMWTLATRFPSRQKRRRSMHRVARPSGRPSAPSSRRSEGGQTGTDRDRETEREKHICATHARLTKCACVNVPSRPSSAHTPSLSVSRAHTRTHSPTSTRTHTHALSLSVCLSL
jgi:hypothetical protein